MRNAKTEMLAFSLKRTGYLHRLKEPHPPENIY